MNHHLRASIIRVCCFISIILSSSIACAADWQIDPSKTHIRFKTSGLVAVDGGFSHFDGQFKGDVLDPEHLVTTFVVQADSATTGSSITDGTLRGSSFFNVEKYPIVTFKSTRMTRIDPAHVAVRGDLTMIGVTKPIDFTVILAKPQFDPSTKTLSISTTASITLNRNEWGMDSYGSMVNKNIVVQVDSVMVSNNVDPAVVTKLTGQ